MPSFSYQDTFREGQWRVFRSFVLEERRDFSSRALVIAAEQSRIGKVEVDYQIDPASGDVTQTRVGITVSPASSSLGKLMAAYLSLGGNPLDISMFLQPGNPDHPGRGFAFPQGFAYSLRGQEQDNDSNINKYKPSRVGGARETNSEVISFNMGLLRQSVTQEMYQKRIRLEERIIKLCDLYEQLEKEKSLLLQAQGDGDLNGEDYSNEKYDVNHSIPALVFLFDSTFRVAEADNRVPTDAEVNIPDLADFPMLMNDGSGDGNNAL